VTAIPPLVMLFVGLGSLFAPPLWCGIRCIIYFSIVLAIGLSGRLFGVVVIVWLDLDGPGPFGEDLIGWLFGVLTWLAGAVLLQFTLLSVLQEPRVIRASPKPTGGRDLDVNTNRLSCCGSRADWRPSAMAELIAKGRQGEPFLYRSVIKRWFKRIDFLTFVRLHKLLAIVWMVIDFLTSVAVGVALIVWAEKLSVRFFSGNVYLWLARIPQENLHHEPGPGGGVAG